MLCKMLFSFLSFTKQVYVLAISLCLSACDGPRPTAAEAEIKVSQLLPNARIIKVKTVEDEVAVRGYDVDYLEADGKHRKKKYLQYFLETKEWKLYDRP
jgi:hypothetical protein